MKFLVLTLLATIIIFFVWNILKRIFFNEFYKQQQKTTMHTKTNEINQKVNWDAETVEYEEIKEDTKHN